ncbi:MAG TPA: Lrp/AsnC family transcriptional regulator [Actinomycetales bacterium]|nr:Lrp/AsnC family transcriptional regulator [Actinomycetales bacterium]
MRLDDVDRRIVAELVADARQSYADIGSRVNLSAPAVKRRVDRMRADGVLRGFTALVDPDALGWTVEAFVELFCEGRVPPAQIRKMLVDIPEVQAAFTVTGDADALLNIRARDMAHFERVLETVRERNLVRQTRSTVVLSRL